MSLEYMKTYIQYFKFYNIPGFLCLIIMKKISLFNATSRRQTRSGDRSDNKPETRRAVSNPESNDTLRKLVDVKHEVTNRTKYFIAYQHYFLYEK